LLERSARTLRFPGAPRPDLLPPTTQKAQINPGLSFRLDEKRGSRQCDRPQAKFARPRGSGSPPRQRLHHGGGQLSRERGRYPHTGPTAKLDLNHRFSADRSLRRQLRRREQHLRKPVNNDNGAELSPPVINLPRTDIGTPRYLGDNRPRRKARLNDCPLLFIALTPSPLRASDYFNARHRTVSCTGASTVRCTGAYYQPEPTPSRRAAITGRLRCAPRR